MVGIGYSLELGLELNKAKERWTLIKITCGHDAEDLLVVPDGTAGWKYISGLADIKLGDNLLLGKSNSAIVQRTGWQVNLFDLFAYRVGRWDGEGFRIIGTSGFSINMNPLFRYLKTKVESDLMAFLAEHVNIAYSRSAYSGADQHPLDGTLFNGIVVSFK
jgi:hypothetical protein